MYGESLKYDYGNSDNLDWNKYAGLQFDLYRPHGRTAMVVFRYNANLNVYEWTFYYHKLQKGLGEYKEVGNVPGYVDESNIILTPVGEVPDFKVEFVNDFQIRLKLRYLEKQIGDLVTFKKLGRYHTRANLYWGGNMPAQGYVEADKKYTKNGW